MADGHLGLQGVRAALSLADLLHAKEVGVLHWLARSLNGAYVVLGEGVDALVGIKLLEVLDDLHVRREKVDQVAVHVREGQAQLDVAEPWTAPRPSSAGRLCAC